MRQIAEILEIKYQTASQWIDDWEDYGIRALYKRHGGGRPCIYDEPEVQRIKELVAEEPRRLSYVKSKIEDETGKILIETYSGKHRKKVRTGLQKTP